MQFNYAAKTMNGDAASGALDADTLTAARQVLRERGLFPLKLTPAHNVATVAAPTAPHRSWWPRKVSKAELMLLTSQLVIMVRSGVDLAEALRNVSTNSKNPTLQAALTDIYNDVAGGRSFSAAIRQQSKLFGDSYVASVAAGEASGAVPDVLERMADLLGKEIKLRTTVVTALSYPLILFGVCLTVIAAMMFFVLPNFEKVFADMEITPPMSTQFLLALAGELKRRFWLWGGGAAIAAAMAWQLLWTPLVRRTIDALALRSKIFGEVLQSLTAGRLFVLLGSMLQSGVPLIEALQLCRSAMRSVCFKELIDVLEDEVLNGRSIGRVLTNSPFIPPGASQMIGTAEGAGKLGVVMQLVGEYYEEEGQRKIQELAKLLEPVIIIVMGVIVAFVVASIMLPILDISTAGAG